MDVVRDVLRKISDSDDKPSWKALVEGKSEDEAKNVLYHIDLLKNAGLLTGIPLKLHGYSIWERLDLTWEGHDFVDATKDSEVWKETQKGLEGVGSFTFDLVRDLAKGFIKKKLEEHTGVKLDL
jgi:hypothetical protein